MSVEIAVRTESGKDPGRVLVELREALRLRSSDLMFAGQRQKTRMLERTARGVDLHERPFAPYSTKGPYYYNPSARNGGVRKFITDSQARSSARRFARRTQGQHAGLSVRYDSYAAFKAALGRTGVDLAGPRAPHMLQAVVIRPGTAQFTLGVYGEPADRAAAHNEGVPGRLPQREWFGASEKDIDAIASDIAQRILARAA